MNYGFKSIAIECSTSDGRNIKVLTPLDYVATNGDLFRIPVDALSDGASTPTILWPTIPPFGNYWMAAVLHDTAYRNTLLVYDTSTSQWDIADLSKEHCDNLLKEAMCSLGVNDATVDVIYEGVRLGGWRSYRNDRSK